MGFYDNAAATADKMLRKFGSAITLTRVGEAVYDPLTGAATPPTPVTYIYRGVKFDYRQNEIDGTLIRQGDQRVYMTAVGLITPQSGDLIVIAGTTYLVVESRPLQPALTSVLHDVQVRGLRPAT